jgi:hypothetical protein
MKRLWKWLNWHPTGIYVQFGVTLALVVGGIFAYFSLVACNEPSSGCNPGQLPPTVSPVSTHSSAWTSNTTIIKPDMEPNITNTGSLYPTFGSLAERKLSWTGNQPDRLIYSPPPGATGVAFPDPTKQPQPGGPPYVFQNPPKDIPVQFNFPAAPQGVTTWTVSETLQSSNGTGTSSVALDTSLTSTGAIVKSSASRIVAAPPNLAAPNALVLQRWYWVDNVTMTTSLCQQVVDWLQSSNTFVALRIPVTFPTGDSNYYKNPALLVTDSTNQARIELTDKTKSVMNPIPLVMRPERLTFAGNRLPAATGERWVTMGVAANPKATCPADLNLTAWEFFLMVPFDLLGNTGEVPIYFCQEGQNPPPLGQAVQKVLDRKPMLGSGGGVQVDGITCIGPQSQNLSINPVIQFGNPAIAWGIKPPREIKIFHEVFVNTFPINLNFSVNSPITGANWQLFWGDKTAPYPSQPVDTPATMPSGINFIWLVGTVPDGTVAGSYNVVISAEKAGDPTVKASVTDLLWVDVWVPPPLPGGLQYIHLPVIMQKQ